MKKEMLMSEKKLPIPNRLLAALPNEEYLRLLPQLKQVGLKFGENIYEQGEKIRCVYFPCSGIISLLAAAEGSATLEVGIVGKEGVIGLPIFLGVKISLNRAIVQGEGLAMRMKAADFLRECRNGGELPQILQRYTHSVLAQISQSAVCYRFHSSEARLARWLLMTSDRLETDEFRITQEFLSSMLGVRREAVNKSAIILQQQQLISYRRGNMSILDQTGLKNAACQCYDIIKSEEKSFPVNKKLKVK
jgi:CRP-like cAMP-binding protein